MRRHLVHRIALAGSLAGLALIGPMTSSACAQDPGGINGDHHAASGRLRDAAPPDAYMYIYAEPDGLSATLRGYYDEITQAVFDQRFDLLALDAVMKALPEDDAALASQLHAHITGLIAAVPWKEVAKGNFLFARSLRVDKEHKAPSDSILLGWELPKGAGADMHRGMRDLLVGLVGLSDELSLNATRGTGDGARVYEGVQSFPSTAELGAGGEGTVYELSVIHSWHGGEFDESGNPIYVSKSYPVGLELAFQGDHFLFGFNPPPHTTGESMIDFALAHLSGDSRPTLADNDRFARALGDHKGDLQQFFYMDFPNMFGSVGGFVQDLLGKQRQEGDSEAAIILNAVTEVADLVSVMESVSSYSYVEDEVLLVSDMVMRYVDSPETRKNPIFLSGYHVRDEPGLIEAVPADTTGFMTWSGLELGPLHDWAVDFVRTKIPEGEKALAVYDGGQATFGIDVRDELLPILASAVCFTSFPARQPTATKSEDHVFLSRSSNPAAARRLWKRATRLLSAGSTFVDDANRALSEISRNVPEVVRFVMPSDLRIEQLNDPFPGMLKLSISVMGRHELIMGSVGDMWVASTSGDAINYVLETFAGDHANITENPEFVARSGMPDRPLWYASYTSYESLQEDMLGMVAAMQGAAGWLPAMMGANGGGGEEATIRQAVFNTVLEVFPKVREVIEVMDFYDSSIGWGFISDDGLTEVYRTVTVHKTPSER